MDKQSFFKALESFKTLELFLTDEISQINEEIYHNCIQVGLPIEITAKLSFVDVKDFLEAVKKNRRAQLNKSNIKSGLIYYVWYDEMAGQLRLNFINSNHLELPFRCQLNFMPEDFIINSYLSSYSSENEHASESYDSASYALNIYKEVISR